MYICFSVLAIIAVALFVERLLCGTHIESLLLNKPIKVGDKMHVYLDGVYNRTATVSKVEPHRVFIYEKLPLHIAYRGRFYATGLTADGRYLVYLSNRNHYRYVRLAELLRIIFNIANNAYMLEPDTEAPIGIDLEKEEEAEE